MNHTIPTEAHLFYASYSGGDGYLTLHPSDSLKNCAGYEWLGVAKVDFGNVEFDEKALVLKALNVELGVAQGKINEIKDKIQQLLAIGHDDEEHRKEQILGDEDILDEVWPGGVDPDGNYSRV